MSRCSQPLLVEHQGFVLLVCRHIREFLARASTGQGVFGGSGPAGHRGFQGVFVGVPALGHFAAVAAVDAFVQFPVEDAGAGRGVHALVVLDDPFPFRFGQGSRAELAVIGGLIGYGGLIRAERYFRNIHKPSQLFGLGSVPCFQAQWRTKCGQVRGQGHVRRGNDGANGTRSAFNGFVEHLFKRERENLGATSFVSGDLRGMRRRVEAERRNGQEDFMHGNQKRFELAAAAADTSSLLKYRGGCTFNC